MTLQMNGVVSLVLGQGKAAEQVAHGLAALGASVARDPETAANAATLIVIPVTDPDGLAPADLTAMSDEDWIRRCEAPLRAVRVAMQTAYRVLEGRGGRIILLVPTISMVGAAGFAPFSAVGEGARSLAKAAARGWGPEGITVNCLALTPEQLHPGAAGLAAETKVPRALGRQPGLETEVAAFIAALAAGPAIVTGATLSLDGGDVMNV